MRVYHFINEKYGLEAIKNNTLKVGKINDLNDPFEFFHLNSDNYVTRVIIKGRRNKANRKHGVICFSQNHSNPVQWAHYSDSHKGLCLGFEIPEQSLLKIDYIEERGSIDEFKDSLNLRYKDFLRLMLSKKYNHWSYEQEYRLLINFKKKPKNKEIIFESFSPDLKLKEVIIGSRSQYSCKALKKIINKDNKYINISKVCASKTKFKMVKE